MRGERIGGMERELDQERQLTAAKAESEEAYRRVEIAIEAETAARALGIGATEAERQRARELTTAKLQEADARQRATEEAKAEWDHFAEMGNKFRAEQERRGRKGQASLAKEIDSEAERRAEETSRILTAPWERLSADVSDITTNMFDEFLQKGTISAEGIGEALSTSMRRSIAGMASNLLMQPFNAMIAGMQASIAQSMASGGGMGGGLMNFARQNPALAAGGLGFVGGSLLGGLTGRDPGMSGLGGALGAAAGTAAFGPVGGIIGGLGGSLLGGMFGGGGGLANDRAGIRYWVGGDRPGKVWEDESSSAENRRAVNAVGQSLNDVQRLLRRQGLDWGGGFGMSLRVGNETGFELDGRNYGSEQELVAASIAKIMDKTYQQVGKDDPLRAVLRETKARSAQELGEDIDFAETYKKLITEESVFQEALDELRDTFADVSFRAKELGLSESKLAAARKKAEKELYDDMMRETEDRSEAASDQARAYFEGLLAPLSRQPAHSASRKVMSRVGPVLPPA